MPRFAANLTMLFTEAPLLERIDRATRAGFKAVEIQFPYDEAAIALRKRLNANGVEMALHNLPAGDWGAGDRGVACDPARKHEFRDGVSRAIEYAQALGAPQLNCLVGKPGLGIDEDRTRSILLENLGYAAEQLRRANLTLLIEPVNTRDVPGFWLSDIPKALSILDEVGADNMRLQFDIYHAQRSGGEIAGTMERCFNRIGHIQFADNPGRNEPGSGELNFGFLFGLIDRLGYQGWVGAEYKPATTTEAGLGWLKAYGDKA